MLTGERGLPAREPDTRKSGEALKVGVIVDEGPRPVHVRELMERGHDSAHYSVGLLVIHGAARSRGPGGLAGDSGAGPAARIRSAVERALFRLLSRLEQVVVARVTGFSRYFNSRPGPASSVPEVYVRPIWAADHRACRYDPDDMRQLRQHDLDLLVYCADHGTPADEVLDAARLGVIALRYGEDVHVLPGPPGFREVYHRQPYSRFRIERINGGVSGAEVLCEGAIFTAPFYLLNAVRLLRKSAVFAHRLLEGVAREGAFPEGVRKVPDAADRPSLPALKDQAGYVLRTSGHFLERASRRLLGARWRWGVAYQFTDDWRQADLPNANPVRNPPGRYFADPFVVKKGGVSVCFVEDYHCRSSRGRITALRLERDGYEELGVALAEPFHLSYPFVFEAGGDLYMCPETEEARDIRLYRCTRFPLEWRLHRVLMDGVAAVDTSIIFHAGRWWMFTNIDSADMGDYRSELHLFHADTFDSRQWQPHPGNPVVFDSARARNGGLFRSHGSLLRVFQVHGFDVYGQSMGVARIDELSTHAYSEEVVATVAPDFLPGIVGTHTMSFDGTVLALDFVRRQRCRP